MMKLHALDGRGRVASMALRKCVIVIGKRGGRGAASTRVAFSSAIRVRLLRARF